MSASKQPIDKLLSTLRIIYGLQFLRSIEGVTYIEVRELWQDRLSYWLDRPYAIDWALQNLPVYCPNVIEFKKLCETAPLPQAARITYTPRAYSAEDRLKITKMLQEARARMQSEPTSIESAATRIAKRIRNGYQVSPIQRDYCKSVLGSRFYELTDQS